jgi:hypothetical protein
MKCQKVRLILDRAIEEHAVIPRDIATHLESCSKCEAYYREQLQLWGMLDLLPAVEPQLGFNARFWQKVREEPARTGWMSGWAFLWPAISWRRAVVGSAFAVLLILASVLIMDRQWMPPMANQALLTTSLEDEQLMDSLGTITSAQTYSALEQYDLWKADTDEIPDFPTPLLIPKDNQNSDSPIRGAKHEKIG